MKNILVVAAAFAVLSFNAHGVTYTIELTPAQNNRAQAAIGEAKGYKTPDTPAVLDAKGVVVTPAVPGVPRDATGPEVRQYINEQLRSLVQSVEQGRKRKAKEAEITAPAAFEVN